MVDIVQLKENGEPKYMKTHITANDGLLDYLFPIGRIIYDLNPTNPGDIYGGTWERIKGRMLIGMDEGDPDFATAGKTGGAKEVTLTIDQMPSHAHGQKVTSGTNGGASRNDYTSDGKGSAYPQGVETDRSGGDRPHNNMPPYMTVYIWRRVA